TVNMHRFFDGENSVRLARSIADEFVGARRHFSEEMRDRLVLIVSGDLAYTGVASEFNDARAFLEELSSELGVTRERVGIAPGNHDVDWASAAIDNARRFDNYLSFLCAFYGEPLFREKYPAIDWDFKVSSARPEAYQIVTSLRLADLGVEIV